MLNILSYIGVSLQSELCLWTLLGLIRTIFDATLFKVNANLKQVWQMSMPVQLSMPVQRVMRTIISGVMLVQCFTVYVYLASYIVLLYPVFLEERPTLVLPWLLLAAIRKFLCELTSLALGLGACVLLGAARPPCIKFVVFKVASITPAFYMWMLVFRTEENFRKVQKKKRAEESFLDSEDEETVSTKKIAKPALQKKRVQESFLDTEDEETVSYYNALKVASQFKRFPATLTMMPSDHDYGLELAVRRRRTKSLQAEEQLRKKLVASLNYGERERSTTRPLSTPVTFKPEVTARMVHSTHADFEDIQAEHQTEQFYFLTPLPNEAISSDQGAYEDWCGSEIIVPRDADRILEQFCLMMLRIAACMQTEGTDPEKLFSSHSHDQETFNNMDCSTPLHGAVADTSPLVSTQGKTASYLENYPQIFMKKAPDNIQLQNESIFNSSQPPNVENIGDGKKILNERIFPMEESSPTNNATLNGNYKSTKASENVTKAYIETKKATDKNKNEPVAVTETQPSTSKKIINVKDDIAPKMPSVLSTTKYIKDPKMHVNYNMDENQLPKHEFLSRSDSQITRKLIEKEIKQPSEETYNSSEASYNVSSMSLANNMDSLDFILHRIKRTLEERRNKTETDDLTSTRPLKDKDS